MSDEKGDELVVDEKSFDSRISVIEGKIYAGNPFTAYKSMLLIALSIFCIVTGAMFNSLAIEQFYPAIMILVLFIVFGLQMNYFVIENGCLLIRNHYFHFLKRSINLKDIKEIDIESPGKWSDSLRIYTNAKSKIFAAGSLRRDNWKELLTDFKSIGIAIKPSMYTRDYGGQTY